MAATQALLPAARRPWAQEPQASLPAARQDTNPLHTHIANLQERLASLRGYL